MSAGAEYVKNPWLLRGGYTGSWFHNDVTSVSFDNPYRLTDSAAVPGRGRLVAAAEQLAIGVNGLVSAKLPWHSRASAYGSTGMLEDAGDQMIPQTINTALTTKPIDRTTVDGRRGPRRPP